MRHLISHKILITYRKDIFRIDLLWGLTFICALYIMIMRILKERGERVLNTKKKYIGVIDIDNREQKRIYRPQPGGLCIAIYLSF